MIPKKKQPLQQPTRMAKPTVVLWPYVFTCRSDWDVRMQWVANSLRSLDYDVYRHHKMSCCKDYPVYQGQDTCDIVIYNHADVSLIDLPQSIRAERTWFFKTTVPDRHQTTLDDLGYGSYSSITYEKPDYENATDEEVQKFFDTRVKKWLDDNACKWGNNHFSIQPELDKEDYYLVLGQCGHDEVVNHQDFGSYFPTLIGIIKELNRVGDRSIVVKLHPKMKEKDNPLEIADKIRKINPDITVYRDYSAIHPLLEKAYCVITGNSGAGFEAMMHHKPIISFAYPEYHWATYDLRKRCDLRRAIQVDNWFDRGKSDRFLHWYMDKYCFFDEPSALRRVKELLTRDGYC